MPYSYRAPLQSDAEPDVALHGHSQSINSLNGEEKGRPRVSSILDRATATGYTAKPTDTVLSVVTTMNANRMAAIVVVDGDAAPIGIISDRDVVRALVNHGFALAAMPARDLMTTNPQTCTLDDSINKVARRMIDGGFRHMPVVHHGHFVGLLSVLDVLKEHVNEIEYENLKIRQAMVG